MKATHIIPVSLLNDEENVKSMSWIDLSFSEIRRILAENPGNNLFLVLFQPKNKWIPKEGSITKDKMLALVEKEGDLGEGDLCMDNDFFLVKYIPDVNNTPNMVREVVNTINYFELTYEKEKIWGVIRFVL